MPPSTFAAIAWNISFTCGHAAGFPPGIIDGPNLAPSSPPETPVPTKRIPFSASALVRRFVSVNSELPPSIKMSPFSRYGSTCSIVWSTTSPAFTISITRRGSFNAAHKSFAECVPTTCVPFASSARKSFTLDVVRLNTATLYPWSFMLSTRFWPITASPIKPISQVPSAISISRATPSWVSQTCNSPLRFLQKVVSPRMTFLPHVSRRKIGGGRIAIDRFPFRQRFRSYHSSTRLTDRQRGVQTMKKIRYGVAMSLDGYIAGSNGEADWIVNDPEFNFAALWAQFDTLLMGRRTYDAAVSRLGRSSMKGRKVVV